MEPWEADCGMLGLAVVFLFSLSDSLSRLTTSYSVSALLFLSFLSIWSKTRGEPHHIQSNPSDTFIPTATMRRSTRRLESKGLFSRV